MQEDSTKQVVYKNIPGFPGYRVGDDGSVWSLWVRGHRLLSTEWRRLKTSLDRASYLYCVLYRNGRMFTSKVHRLVCEAFHGPCPLGQECCHNDGNPSNNVANNLRWGTRKENMDDRIQHGTDNSGERHGQAKLNEAKVIEARARCAAGESRREVAESLGVRESTIGSIVRRDLWRHIP